MSKKINDGGFAFPRAGDEEHYPTDSMSLRDWFAGQIIAGMAASDCRFFGGAKAEAEQTASRAYLFADAMIAQRAKGSR